VAASPASDTRTVPIQASTVDMAEFQDRTLICCDCGSEFIFTAGEQHFFHDKNFKNEPKRCKACKGKRQGGGGHGFVKTETMTTCSQCGRATTVPFKPTQGRPVFCRECFQSRKTNVATP
jgi:CxxC-x17-CxxC domain-containing protein